MYLEHVCDFSTQKKETGSSDQQEATLEMLTTLMSGDQHNLLTDLLGSLLPLKQGLADPKVPPPPDHFHLKLGVIYLPLLPKH